MKNFLLLVVLLCSIAIHQPLTSCAALNAVANEQVQAAPIPYMPVEAYSMTGLQSEPPAVTIPDLLTPPSSQSSTADKIYWVIGVIVLLLWEIVFRLIPTTRSISILTILYNVFNMFLKDKAKNGGMFKVKKE